VYLNVPSGQELGRIFVKARAWEGAEKADPTLNVVCPVQIDNEKVYKDLNRSTSLQDPLMDIDRKDKRDRPDTLMRDVIDIGFDKVRI
jgi:hypothetical protein